MTAWEIKFAHQVKSLRDFCEQEKSNGKEKFFEVILTGEEAVEYCAKKLGQNQDAHLREYSGVRTLAQNNGLWATLRRAAEAMNDGGQPVLINPMTGLEQRWSEKTVHDFLLLPIIQDTYQRDSTAKLDKKQISTALDGLIMGLAQKFGYSIAGMDGR